jgi:hypothetical protein
VVIVLLVGYIFYQALNRIEKVEDDYREMRELKGRAEAADVAKSQVPPLLATHALTHQCPEFNATCKLSSISRVVIAIKYLR